MKSTWTPEKITQAYRDLRAKLGRVPQKREFVEATSNHVGEIICEGKYHAEVTSWETFLTYLQEEGRTRRVLKGLSDDEILAAIRDTYKGKKIGVLTKKDPRLWNIARERGLDTVLIGEGTLSYERTLGFYTACSDRELQTFIAENYKGLLISEFYNKDITAYQQATKRGLISQLVEQGILIRKREKAGKWQDPLFVMRRAKELCLTRGTDILPSGTTLRKEGQSMFYFAVSRYHGGFPAFREKLKVFMETGRVPAESEHMQPAAQAKSLLEAWVDE